MLFDTHGHVNFNAFKSDSAEVLQRALDNDIWVVMPGSQYTTSRRAVDIAESFKEGVYAAVGIHPMHLEQRKVGVQETQSEARPANPPAGGEQSWEAFETRAEEFDYEKYKELALRQAQGKPKVVAIGEVGLDYYYFPKSKTKREELKQKQRETLRKQLDLAQEFNLPAILHCRNAFDDLFDILDTRYKILDTPLRGVIHSYTGTAEQAQRFIELGFYIGFNGLIFKDVPALPNPKEVISSIPLEKIVVETDSPYLAVPAEVLTKAGAAPVVRNEPLFVKYVAEEIARIKKIDMEEIAAATSANAKALFRI